MMLLGIHFIAITLLILMTGAVAYTLGLREGERRVRRRMEIELEEARDEQAIPPPRNPMNDQRLEVVRRVYP